MFFTPKSSAHIGWMYGQATSTEQNETNNIISFDVNNKAMPINLYGAKPTTHWACICIVATVALAFVYHFEVKHSYFTNIVIKKIEHLLLHSHWANEMEVEVWYVPFGAYREKAAGLRGGEKGTDERWGRREKQLKQRQWTQNDSKSEKGMENDERRVDIHSHKCSYMPYRSVCVTLCAKLKLLPFESNRRKKAIRSGFSVLLCSLCVLKAKMLVL